MSTSPPAGPVDDDAWLNDRTGFQLNFVHGLRNPSGLHLQYRLEEGRVVTEWTPQADHVGFPGYAHGGLVAAVLDDVMGRCSVLRRRWAVTGRLETRYRSGAPLGVGLRAEGWVTRWQRRVIHAEGRLLVPNGDLVAEATGTYLPISARMQAQMLEAWPGFRDYI